MDTIFLNYSEEDEALAKRIYADLLAGGVRLWAAAYDLAPGDDELATEKQAAMDAGGMIVLVTKKYLRNSVAVELTQTAQEAGKLVVPVLADRGIKTPAGLPDAIKLKRRYAEAVTDLIEALPTGNDPVDEIPALQRGNAAYFADDFETALKCYEEIKEPTPEILNSRAATLNALRKHEQALEAVNQAIEGDSDRAKYYINRSLALSALNRHEEALQDDLHGIELEPESPRARSVHAMTLYALKRYGEAQEAISRAIELNPDEAYYYYQSSMFALQEEKYDEALAALDSALQLDPDNPDIQSIQQIILGRSGRADEALAQINREIKKDPRRGGNYITRSLINFYLERYEDAVEDATAAIERGQNQQAAPFFNRAIAYWKLDETEKAQDDLLVAIGFFPDLETPAGIVANAESELTRDAGLAVLESLQESGKLEESD